MALDPDMLLPCGRDPIDVVDGARSGRTDAHGRACPYCREAVAADRDQRRVADELRAAETPAPDTLLPSVMATVWAELRPGRHIPLPTRRPSFITELAAGTLLENVLSELPRLEIRLCEVRLAVGAPEATDPAAPSVDITITAAAAYPADLAELAAELRRATRSTLTSQLRLTARTVDVSFDDVFDPREETP